MTILHFVRHGETDWNRDGLIQGSTDVPLSQRGHEQARVLASELSRRPVTAIYAADLQRAAKTAEPLALALGLDVQQTLALRERDFGVNEGRVANEVAAERGTERGTQWMTVDDRHPGGESIRELYERVARFLDELLDHPPDGEIVLVTSGGTICVATAHLERRPVETIAWQAFENCSVTTLNVEVTPGS